MVNEIGQGGRHGVVVFSSDDNVGISFGNDFVGILEDFRCLGTILVVMVGPFQQWKLDHIRVYMRAGCEWA